MKSHQLSRVEPMARFLTISGIALTMLNPCAHSAPSRRGGQQADVWVRQVLQAMHDHRWDWIAWDLHPAAEPSLISDWNYTPTPTFGAFVKQELAGTLPPYSPPANPAPTSTTGPTR